MIEKNTRSPIFYSSFWGHTFKSKTDQLFNWVRSDIRNLSNRCKELRGSEADIYRYQECRESFIANFFGDFLTYLNTDKGSEIRKQILNQFQDFVNSHPEEKEIIIISHSLGTLVLWNLLFARDLPENDPANKFRKFFNSHDSKFELRGIVTMGSPLLFMGIKQNMDFSAVDDFTLKNKRALSWVNIIHASDVIAYPLGNAIKHDKVEKLFFTDQYLWENANGAESGALRLGQPYAAMALGMADAHSSYWNNDISADLVSSLLRRHLTTLATKRVHTGWHSYSEDIPKNSSIGDWLSQVGSFFPSGNVSQVVGAEREITVSVELQERSLSAQLPTVNLSAIDASQNEATMTQVFDKVCTIISEQFSVDENKVSLSSHLSNDLGANDWIDFIELIMALEEEFDIEISDSETEDELGIQYCHDSCSAPNSSSRPKSGSVFGILGAFSSTSSSSFLPSVVNAGCNCIVRSFVDLIHKKSMDNKCLHSKWRDTRSVMIQTLSPSGNALAISLQKY